MAELKRCPECGGVATVIHMYDTYDRADFGWDAGRPLRVLLRLLHGFDRLLRGFHAGARLLHGVAGIGCRQRKAAVECARADYAEAHPWHNLCAWIARKLKMA